MQLLDWLIVIMPVIFLICIAYYSMKYVRGVVDFLAAGRVAGRYVLSVGDMAAGLSVISLVAGAEQSYQTGFSVGFWGSVAAPIWIFLSLSGFCIYRWRETRCLSLGQFLELRYGSKFFRIFCAALRTIAEMVTNAIGPAVATNFFIYYLGLPHKIMICGINLPCYAIIVTLCLCLAILFIWPSGRISLLITDSIQALLSYPIFVIIVGYIILKFSWTDDIAPVMWNRVEGQSFMSPYDVSKMRDFNIFAIIVTICGNVLNRASWIGNDTSGAAKSAHEQKMAGILGAWRNGLSGMMVLLLAVITITFMNSPNFMGRNKFGLTCSDIRNEITQKALSEAVPDELTNLRIMESVRKLPAKIESEYVEYRKTVAISPEKLAAARSPENPRQYLPLMQYAVSAKKDPNISIPVEVRATLVQPPLSQQKNMDASYLAVINQELGDSPQGRLQFQKVRSLYNQMMMPVLIGRIFPCGMLGIFCLLMIMLLVSTDDSRIFNASSTLVQDCILPFFKEHVDSKFHIRLLRLMSIGVAVFFLIVSLFFAQLDYINMFTTIMCSLWLGGAGPIMLFGLYSRFGNLWGAWAAIIFGSGTSLLGLIFQRNWALTIYPFIERMGWVDEIDWFLRTVSGPFNPWIVWSMDKVKFPINSFEIYFISMVLALGGYILVSFLTYKPYNLDKLLHRGKYSDNPDAVPVKENWTFGRVIRRMVGITPDYTKVDRIIAWSVFFYSFVWSFVILTGGVVLWNAVSPWPHEWWTIKFFITTLLIPGIIGIVSTIWFLLGGIHDILDLFKSLERRNIDPNDNGQVMENEKIS